MADDQRITTLPGKTIGITGKIELYQGKPEIQITSADQIKDLELKVQQKTVVRWNTSLRPVNRILPMP
jgi:DNA/RNA endonuclease YhcR with UshA esterase domain